MQFQSHDFVRRVKGKRFIIQGSHLISVGGEVQAMVVRVIWVPAF